MVGSVIAKILKAVCLDSQILKHYYALSVQQHRFTSMSKWSNTVETGDTLPLPSRCQDSVLETFWLPLAESGGWQLCRVLTSRGSARGNVMNLCDKRPDYISAEGNECSLTTRI